MRPRLLIFDVDGTVYDQGRLRRRLLPQLARHCVSDPREGWETLRILYAWRQALETLRHAGARVAIPAAQIEATTRATGFTEGRVLSVLDRWFHSAPLPFLRASLRPGLIDLLDAAGRHGTPCAVFSDYDPARKLQAMGIADRFQAVLSAADPLVQAYKPNPRGLEVLLDRFGVSPRETLYFGDRPGVDDAAARAAGIPFLLIGARGFSAKRILDAM